MKEAIALSGVTGTKLKCDVIGKYYPFWWKITSGGKRQNYGNPTAIVELYAATGEDYIKETGETILGSSGHALELKVNHFSDDSIDTSNLKVVLVEEHPECFAMLKKVIQRRWPSVPIPEAEGPINSNSSNIYLFNKGLEEATAALDRIPLGNTIFYFDPLRNVEWTAIDTVARKRITVFNLTGTEFLIFLFTSDWFLGRDALAPLPQNNDQFAWNKEQESTVLKADALFGSQGWRKYVLNPDSVENREKSLLSLYKFRLHKWFRYVLPLPFSPKKNQLFHVILCSNYEAGVRATKEFYDTITGNPSYLPGREPSQKAYACFKKEHPEITQLSGNKRPLEWRLLWNTIKYHEEGICDRRCKDFRKIESQTHIIKSALEWLQKREYLKLLPRISAWDDEMYVLNWKTIKKTLDIDQPPELKPISAEEFVKIQWRKALEAFEARRVE